MYVYCENNTVNRMDLLGDSWVSVLKNATANFVTNIVKKTAEVVNAIAQKNNVVLSSSNNGHGNLPLTGEPNSTVRIGFGGYLLYRGIRMIPSLFPALWWTIPANVVAP